MIRALVIFIILLVSDVYAGTITMPQYTAGGSLTADNLNERFNLPTNVLNGGLDNNNANTTDGFRFIEVLGELPAAGNQGRVVFLLSDDLLHFDDGSQFLSSAVYLGTAAQGDVLYFDGTNWRLRTAGTANYPLVTNGAGANPDWEQLATVGISDDAVTFAKVDDDGNFGLFTGDWSFNELALVEDTAPSTAASEGKLYTKDTGGQPELFYREESDGDEVQVTTGGNLASTSATIYSFNNLGSGGNTSFATLENSKFKKIVGVDTITSYAYAKRDAASGTTTVRVEVNSSLTGDATTTSDSLTWITATVDVSSLTDGTVYDLTIQVKNDDGNSSTVDNSIGFGT